MWLLGIELGSLEEQPVLLTSKPSLQLLESSSYVGLLVFLPWGPGPDGLWLVYH